MRKLVNAFAFWIFLSGSLVYAQGVANLAPGFTNLSAGAKIALAPVDVELFEVGVGGVSQPKADWTEAASKHLLTGLRNVLSQKGASLQEIPSSQADDHDELLVLNGAVSQAIAIHHATSGNPNALPSKEGRLDWSFGTAVQPLQQATGADYALLVWVRDSYASAERKAVMVGAMLLGVYIPGGIQAGFSTLVDLKTGQIVWFNRMLNMSGDLRNEPSALSVVEGLLRGFPAASSK